MTRPPADRLRLRRPLPVRHGRRRAAVPRARAPAEPTATTSTSSAGRGGTERPTSRWTACTLHGVGQAAVVVRRPTASARCARRRRSRPALPSSLRGGLDVVDCSATPYLPLVRAWVGDAPDADAACGDVARVLGRALARLPAGAAGRGARGDGRSRPARAGSATSVVAVSDFTARAMALPDGRVQIVPNGIDPAEIERGARSQRSGRHRVRRPLDRREAR